MKRTGKDKASDIPSWAAGEKPRRGESGKEFADRLLTQRYEGQRFATRPGSEHNKLRKFGDRAK